MGLSTKQVSGDQGIENWSQTNLLQSDAAELAKPPPIRRQQPPQEQSELLKCPRCGSTNTKFCYYNNYNKSQPRHFCKGCKRHWTKGGTLRNVPVGGGRKNKRPKISNAPATTTTSVASTATATTASLPMSANTANNQKSMSNILYQALIRNSSTMLHETNAMMNSTGLNIISAPQNAPNSTDLIQFSSLSNTSLIYPTSHQSFDNHYIANLDSLEESTITTVNINPSSSSELWAGPDTSTTLDLPNYWNWNDINVLSSADLNISWDDQDEAEIKP